MTFLGRAPLASTGLCLFASVLWLSHASLTSAEPMEPEALPAKNPLLPPPDLRSVGNGAVLVKVFEHSARAGGTPLAWGDAEDKAKFQGFSPFWEYRSVRTLFV